MLLSHSAVGHSQSPDPLSATCFQTNSETPTALSHWRHSSSTSISVLQRIRGVYVYALFKSIVYLLTYLLTSDTKPELFVICSQFTTMQSVTTLNLTDESETELSKLTVITVCQFKCVSNITLFIPCSWLVTEPRVF